MDNINDHVVNNDILVARSEGKKQADSKGVIGKIRSIQNSLGALVSKAPTAAKSRVSEEERSTLSHLSLWA